MKLQFKLKKYTQIPNSHFAIQGNLQEGEGAEVK